MYQMKTKQNMSAIQWDDENELFGIMKSFSSVQDVQSEEMEKKRKHVRISSKRDAGI